MKIKTLLELQHTIEGTKIPSDITEDLEYYSESKEEFIKIFDMELTHVIRALNSSKIYKDLSTSDEECEVDEILDKLKFQVELSSHQIQEIFDQLQDN